MNLDEFKKEISKLGINASEEQLNKLDIYASYLLEYNEHTNLTAIRNIEDVYLKHFYDSLTLVKVIDLKQEESLLDIGSGAGFPGMVLKIFFPNLHVTLIDSNNKKTTFLKNLKERLGVDNCEVINDRIENITKSRINSYDIVTARAVTNMPVLTELAMPLVKINKYFIAMKGSNEEEIDNSSFAIKKMNGELEKNEKFELFGAGTRTLIKIKKLKETEINELRTYDKIIKKPLIK